MKMWPVGTKLFYAYEETEGYCEANSRFTQFCECA